MFKRLRTITWAEKCKYFQKIGTFKKQFWALFRVFMPGRPKELPSGGRRGEKFGGGREGLISLKSSKYAIRDLT